MKWPELGFSKSSLESSHNDVFWVYKSKLKKKNSIRWNIHMALYVYFL